MLLHFSTPLKMTITVKYVYNCNDKINRVGHCVSQDALSDVFSPTL